MTRFYKSKSYPYFPKLESSPVTDDTVIGVWNPALGFWEMPEEERVKWFTVTCIETKSEADENN